MELRLSEDFRNAAWGDGDGFVSDISLGNAFSYNAEKLAREIFSNVVITRGLANENQNEIDAILTPKAILIDMPWVQGTWNDTVITAVVEWTLTDSDGNILWASTIVGEGHGTGGTKRGPVEKRVKALNDDLFDKSFVAISSSPEIAAFAESR